jgi:3-isopropylmalate dehydrogenase
MSAYGNLRPCFFASDALVDSSPLKADVCRGTDFVIVRELTGGIYFGERQEDDGSGYAWDKEPYSRPEVERVARLAGFLARGRGDKKVMSLDKANVLATSRLWRNVMTETFEREFPDLKVEHQLIDSAAMIMVKNPTALNGVVVTSNLFGDIVSDEASVIPGSIGLLPSGSLSGIPDGKGKCNGIYEPIHGKFSFFSFFFFFFPLQIPNLVIRCYAAFADWYAKKALHPTSQARASSTPLAPSSLWP